MLSVYQGALFAVPENPVMRAVNGAPVMPSAGATLEPLKKGGGMGCACGVKPFGLGLVNDESAGLGSYWGVPRAGMGDLETMLSNFTTGQYGAALTGNDIASSLPNWVVLVGTVWLFFTLNSQQKSARRSVGRTVGRIKARAKGRLKTDWSPIN
jgi:hypothetical protein